MAILLKLSGQRTDKNSLDRKSVEIPHKSEKKIFRLKFRIDVIKRDLSEKIFHSVIIKEPQVLKSGHSYTFTEHHSKICKVSITEHLKIMFEDASLLITNCKNKHYKTVILFPLEFPW